MTSVHVPRIQAHAVTHATTFMTQKWPISAVTSSNEVITSEKRQPQAVTKLAPTPLFAVTVSSSALADAPYVPANRTVHAGERGFAE